MFQPWRLQRHESHPVHMSRTCELPNRLISLLLRSDPPSVNERSTRDQLLIPDFHTVGGE